VKKKVVVVGAGPAGMEAAVTASERGHEVILYEKDDEPGGNIRLGCIPPFKQDLRRLLQYYERRLKESNVRFVPKREMSVDELKNEGADVIVVAVGAPEYVPDIPGIAGERVTAARDFYLADYLQKQSEERAVVIGAGDVGCEIAWYLALLGRSVSLIDVLPYEQWITEEHPTNRFILMEQLSKNEVQILDSAKKLEIAPDALSVSLEREGMQYTISSDLVVLATGYKKSDQFTRELRMANAPSEICTIGDCADPRDIHWAIREGYETGTRI
jgi:NADPH-dependent 2,4-dienoyl-CoA reductase/sulfur reductase-like enzyme